MFQNPLEKDRAMRKKLLIANWKMCGTSITLAALFKGLRLDLRLFSALDLVLCPPAVFLALAKEDCAALGIGLGIQNVSEHSEGAFTGEISGTMAAELGCHYALIGHSERRSLYGETDQIVAQKWARAQEAGLKPVLCVGETEQDYRQGLTLDVIHRQLQAVLSQVSAAEFAESILAYEPVWAIGTGLTPSSDEIEKTLAYLRQILFSYDRMLGENLRILYGGSIKPQNAAELLNLPNVDGGLVGGASLSYDTFAAIYRSLNLEG